MDTERSATIEIGGKPYELILTTRAPKKSPAVMVGWKTS